MVSVISSQFGGHSAEKFQKLIDKQVIFLNKVPYEDRMDEIIIQGEIVGIFRFNLIKGAYELLPRVNLANELWNSQSKAWVGVDLGAKDPILKGASILSPGIVYADSNISVNDPVIVVCENDVIAVGLAKMNGPIMGPHHKGVAVKNKYRKKPMNRPLLTVMMNWDRIVDANFQSLEILEKEAIKFIKLIAKRFQSHVVAYSGGKDSLVTLDLVAQSNVLYEIIFSDTGLEYPETLENIRIIEQKYQKKVVVKRNESWDFWKRFDQFGPPSRNSRWCCKSAKLFPVNEILEDLYPHYTQVLSYIGKRRFESLGRSREPRVSKNPWIPKQVTASPINNWNAFEVFLYIQKHNLTEFLNPLYNEGFIRIGCWVCPASSMSDFEIMKETHNSLVNQLTRKLRAIQEKYGLSEQYITWGLWRWKFLPQKIINLLKSEDISYHTSQIPTSNKDELKFSITSSPSACVEGGFSSLLSANQLLELERIKRLIPILGSVQYDDELDILSVSTRNQGSIDVFYDGSIIIKGRNEPTLNKKTTNTIKTIYRVIHCDGCGVCTYQCNKKALIVESGIIKVLIERCNQCLVCNNFCPMISYRDDTTFLVPSQNQEKYS